MLFKPWMTRAELAAQRRQEDETKFWVVALRVPLRAMFHIGDLLAQAMGPIIHRHPPEPDPSRPKLMNLKFDLAREAEERFEEKLPMKLEDGEMYEVQLVCKATPWCTRCRWWFHTENEGCPRAEEVGDEGRETSNNNSQRQQRGEVIFDRNIRDAARDPRIDNPAGGESSRAGERRQVRELPPAGRQEERVLHQAGGQPPWIQQPMQGQANLGGSAYPGQLVNQGAALGPGGTAVGGSDPYLMATQWNQMWQQPQVGENLQGGWINSGLPGYQFPVQRPRPMPWNYGMGGSWTPGAAPIRPEVRRGDWGQEERVVVVDGSEDRVSRQVPGEHPSSSNAQNELAQGEDRELEEKRTSISDGVRTHDADDLQFEEKLLLPLICTLLGQEAFILGLINRAGQTVLPSTSFRGIPSPEMIEAKVRQLYADRFCFRLFPEEIMPKNMVESPGGKRYKFYIPLIDARIPVPHWAGLPAVGLTCMPLRILLGDSNMELEDVVAKPGLAATFMRGMNERMPLDKNLESGFIQQVLAEEWQRASPQASQHKTQADGGRIQEVTADNITPHGEN
ncbi:hypothetical protein CBR_g39608 [Chara braunii]|uniref:Uncharacterized protein n=1 Tax=Chara braunii TaxID=69332 RepID=A0A388K199_CHABU|nr:hypothetical protein CBR_g39608 [Chara braunii]|eukprot:GBG63824.1 hypothetical protein CBR_g39608 [Chara braunii]